MRRCQESGSEGGEGCRCGHRRNLVAKGLLFNLAESSQSVSQSCYCIIILQHIVIWKLLGKMYPGSLSIISHSSVQISLSVVSDSLQSHRLQHAGKRRWLSLVGPPINAFLCITKLWPGEQEILIGTRKSGPTHSSLSEPSDVLELVSTYLLEPIIKFLGNL